MKKTVYMISSMFFPSIGGVENHIYFISKNLVKKGFDVKIIHPVLGEKSNIEILDGIEIHNIGVGNEKDKKKYHNLKLKSNGGKLSFIYGYLRKYMYNNFAEDIYKYIEADIEKNNIKNFIFHQHDFISSMKLSKKISKKYKIIFTNHTGEYLFLRKIPFNKIIIKFLTKQFSYIIAPSDELASFNDIRHPNTFKFIPNGVDLDVFKEKDKWEIDKIKIKYNIDKDKISVLCPRRWAPTKGVIYLIKAIALLKKAEMKNVSFIFVGNDYNDYPEYKKEIDDIINFENLHSYINLLGNVKADEMADLINCSDIVVLPSIMEAVSLSALEAMACNKIIIATDVGGFPQIINDGENGFMIPHSNEKELSSKLMYIINNISDFEFIGKNAGVFARNNYSWDSIADETIKIYNNYTNI